MEMTFTKKIETKFCKNKNVKLISFATQVFISKMYIIIRITPSTKTNLNYTSDDPTGIYDVKKIHTIITQD